jgi:hypothetical protein
VSKEQKVPVSIRTRYKREIEQAAEEDGRTVSNWVGQAVKEFLERRRVQG